MKRYFKALVLTGIFGFMVINSNAISLPGKKRYDREHKGKNKLSKEEVLKAARLAYVYGLPAVFTDFTRQASGAPNNIYAHGHKFPDHTSRLVVAPNNDTNYSSAFLDLGDDAVVLTIPDTHNRYYVVPLMDAWTNVFATFGKRTTGTGPQTYIVTGPHWKGTLPEGIKEIKAPTDLVWIIGRIQVNSPDDQANFVSKIQDQFRITLLSNWGKADAVTPKKITTYNVNLPQLKAAQAHQLNVVQAVKQLPVEDYFNYLNALLVKNPGLPADSATLRSLAAIGIGAGRTFRLGDFDKDTQTALSSVPEQIFQAFDTQKRTDFKPTNGTKLGHYKTDYLTRAVVAYKGLGALTPEEATYIAYAEDADKAPLDGTNKYVIHFEPNKLPPAKAFWSLTMYDKDRYLADNPIKRYAIGDRNPLKFNADGSLDIYVQHENPGAGKEANWLPAPADSFNVILRIYIPSDSYLADKATWVNPPLKKQLQ
ncbi:DUF1254 domain-containing protein [Mucilaginibacter sp.]|uniref:DUF1254 domain-containing protein n=1 Tax=Mucilaginibacter sp. TaxID=1882438 RepID=UPI002ED12CB5